MNDETQLLCKRLVEIISPVVRSGRRLDYYAIVSAVIWELRDGALDASDGCVSHAARQLGVKRTALAMALKGQDYKKPVSSSHHGSSQESES
jgi:hypothetical protein